MPYYVGTKAADGLVVSPSQSMDASDATIYFSDYMQVDNPLEHPLKESDGVYRTMTTEEVLSDTNTLLLTQTVFTKLQIRKAMRTLGIESTLTSLLENDTFKTDWDDAQDIDLSDSMTLQALTSAGITDETIVSIKKQVLGIA